MFPKILYWLPRIILTIYAILLGFLTFHVKGGFNIKNLIPIILHSLPALIIIATIVISWKKEALGAIIFGGLGILFTLFFHTYSNIESFFIISLPLFLASILFYMNHIKNKINS